MWSNVKQKIMKIVNRLLDGSWQQIARRCIIIIAVIVGIVIGVSNIDISKSSPDEKPITLQQAKDKTDIRIVTTEPEKVVGKPDEEDSNNDSKVSASPAETGKKETTKTISPTRTTKPLQTTSPNIKKADTDNNFTKRPDKTKEPEKTAKPDKQEVKRVTCKFKIVCERAVEDIDLIDNPEVKRYIPDNGVIIDTTTLSVNKGSTVYDILTAVTSEKKIQLDASYSRINKTAYIKGINHLYEKDAGGDSGWVYMVNGVKPSVGCAGYVVKDNDVIKWAYSVKGYGQDIE